MPIQTRRVAGRTAGILLYAAGVLDQFSSDRIQSRQIRDRGPTRGSDLTIETCCVVGWSSSILFRSARVLDQLTRLPIKPRQVGNPLSERSAGGAKRAYHQPDRPYASTRLK